MRHSKIQSTLLWQEQGGPSTGRSCHPAHRGKLIGSALTEHVDVTLAAAHVQPFARGVVEEIVGVAHRVNRSNAFSGGRVVNQHARWLATADEQSMIRLIE